MALLDIRQRVGWLFMTVIVAHLILISAQVSSRRGVPLLEEAIFGAVAEVQRVATGGIGEARGAWHNYVNLRADQPRERRAQAAPVAARGGAAARARAGGADAGAAGNARPQEGDAVLDHAGDRDRQRREPRLPHHDARQGKFAGAGRRHGRDRAGRRRRPGDSADAARGEGAAHHRPERRRGRARRADAGPGRGRWVPAATGCASNTCPGRRT